MSRAVLLALLLALPAAAEASGPACHCFREREFDPARPAASDPYLLATAANSLLAAAYGVPKREIVEARMSGTPAEDLWIAAYAGARQGAPAAELLAARSGAASWRLALQARGAPLEALGARFVGALAGGAADAALARLAAGETLAGRLAVPQAELDALARAGASLQETVLAALIGRWSSRSPAAVLAEVRSGTSAWSALLAATGREPKRMEDAVRALLR